VELTKRLS